MNKLQLIEILSLPSAEEVIKSLQKSSFDKLPKWTDLEKEYDAKKHSIWDEIKYPAKLNENGQDDFKRTCLALQELAVNRTAQAMFSTPVQRVYSFDKSSEIQQKAVDILEELYRTHNYIDSENIERCKQLGAGCQIATVWKVFEKQTLIKEEISKFKLTHTTYSPMDGYTLYPILDENNELLVLSIYYKDAENVSYFLVFTNTEIPEFRLYRNQGKWVLDTENSKPLSIFPVVYSYLTKPVWGGAAGTNKVEQLEEMESYQGMYIKRNTLPTFTLDYGEISGSIKVSEDEKSTDSRRIIKVGKGGNMKDVTWPGAEEAVTSRYNRLRNAFFEEIQVPDTSFSNMIASNTSSENKEMIFADAKAKARDLGGEWERLFYEELNIVKEFAKILFPKYVSVFDIITVRSVIKPYTIRTKKENAEYVSLASAAMSLETQVRVLDEVDDVSQEVELIQDQQSAQSNQMI